MVEVIELATDELDYRDIALIDGHRTRSVLIHLLGCASQNVSQESALVSEE